MKRFLTVICVLAGLAALLLAPATAYASPPAAFSGTFAVGRIDVLDVRQADGNMIVRQIEYGTLAGDVAGPFTFERTVIVHSNGEVNVHGIMTVAPASMLGRSGTYTQRIDAKVTAGAIEGRLTSLSGTGDLANVHAQGTFAGVAGVAGTYSGQIHFDPD